MEAIGNAGSAIGILSKDGVVLVGEKKVTSKLLQTSTSSEKMYKIDDHVACVVAGVMSDANILINTAMVQAQRYTFSYQEPMPVEQLVQSVYYKDDITREEAVQIALKVLSKTLDNTSLTSKKLELVEVFLSNGKVKYQACSPDTLNKILVNAGLTQPAIKESQTNIFGSGFDIESIYTMSGILY
ncbi:Proteasome subunit alpha type-4 [Capsicum annuum]|uniref:Proteasome subunit alpha type-4 n=1 Tax=Capsicum annuum TaxID=4072 RepID=A0A2G2YKI3_CAPAN|nr:Proteasome subunit alpha type-4 [Capsicum annuum]